MPGFLKAIYLGAAGLAAIAFVLGLYEYVFVGTQKADFGSDVFLPFAVLLIVVALYVRRKKEIESRRSQSRAKRHEKT